MTFLSKYIPTLKKFFNEGVESMGFIKENGGQFDLFVEKFSGKAFVASYSRKRDAVRGATRRGIVLNG